MMVAISLFNFCSINISGNQVLWDFSLGIYPGTEKIIMINVKVHIVKFFHLYRFNNLVCSNTNSICLAMLLNYYLFEN